MNRFPGLIPGIYQVKVVVTGFETMVKTNIELQVHETARIDFTLSVGQATQTIEVAANGALLTTESATFGTVIEERRIVELPLTGRNCLARRSLDGRHLRLPPRRASRRASRRHPFCLDHVALWSARISNTDVKFNLYVVLLSVDAIVLPISAALANMAFSLTTFPIAL